MTRVIDPVMKDLRELLLLMGSRAEAILDKAVRSIIERDAQLAGQVEGDDREIDRLDVRVDEAVLRALALQADYPNAHYNLANALLKAGRAKEAVDHFKQSLTSSPGGADVHNNLGIALAEEGRLDEAVAEFEKALTFEPNSARVHRNLGEVLARLGRSGDGLTHLRRAVELDPSDPALHYALATILVEQDRLDEAVVALQTYPMQMALSAITTKPAAICLKAFGIWTLTSAGSRLMRIKLINGPLLFG